MHLRYCLDILAALQLLGQTVDGEPLRVLGALHRPAPRLPTRQFQHILQLEVIL